MTDIHIQDHYKVINITWWEVGSSATYHYPTLCGDYVDWGSLASDSTAPASAVPPTCDGCILVRFQNEAEANG